ncbi:Toll5bp [Halocaridina rubra]|uniref:Toll5bp n=1 Tax=Halocaridina rubra TaxID=373956 RepID=A0AAN8XJB5_HALRR
MFPRNLEYIFLLSWLAIPTVRSLSCGQCDRLSDKIICPGSLDPERYEVEIKNLRGGEQNYLHLKCRHKAQFVNFTLIKDCDFASVQYVGFELCPLPNVSFSKVFERMGIRSENVTSFSFTNVMQRNDELQEWHLENLPSLKFLELKENGFTSVPANIFDGTPLLQHLVFAYNRMQTLPQTLFSNLKNLTKLDLHSNELEVLPSDLFSPLGNLRNLSLWRNHLRRISPDLLASVPRLWSLELSHNKISSFDPNVFAETRNLTKLLIDNNNLEILPENVFHNCPHLEILRVNNNKISAIPPGLFRETVNLKELEFSNNEIKSLPPIFSNMTHLVKLKLKRNGISILPLGIFEGLTKLEVLDLQSNIISSLSPGIFDDLTALEILVLQNNTLSELPDKIFEKCGALAELYIGVNKIATLLPSMFPNPCIITKLDLSNNNISFASISFEIQPGPQQYTVQEYFPLTYLTMLSELHLKNNAIKAMPQALATGYQNLTLLDLENNQITRLDFNDLSFKSDNIKIDFRNNWIRSINLNRMNSSSSRKNVEIYVKDNALVCDCELYAFTSVVQGKLDQMDANGIRVADAFDVTCSYPEEPQMKTNVVHLNAEALTCKLPTCANHCSCSTRPYDHMFIVDCAHQNLKSVPNLKMKDLPVDHNYSITLNLRNNSIASLRGLDNKAFTGIVNLTVCYNNLDSLNETLLPTTLRALDISGNNVSTLSTSMLEYLNMTNLVLRLGKNPWTCDCNNVELHSFVRDPDRRVIDIHDVKCSNLNNESLINFTEEELCPVIQQPLVIVSISSIAVFLLLFAILGTVSFYKYKQDIKVWLFTHRLCLWAVLEEEKDADKKYDAFISYSDKDEEFVNTVLVPGLESGEPRYRVCIHYRDWAPGEYIQNQIDQSVEASRRTIVVLSSNFIQHVWGQIEFKTAHSKALKDKANRIIVIVLGKVPPESEMDEELKLYISTRTYLQESDPKFWEKLRYAMPHPPDLLGNQKSQREGIIMEIVKRDTKVNT